MATLPGLRIAPALGAILVVVFAPPRPGQPFGVLTAASTARSPRRTARCALLSDLSTRADGATSELRRGERKSDPAASIQTNGDRVVLMDEKKIH